MYAQHLKPDLVHGLMGLQSIFFMGPVKCWLWLSIQMEIWRGGGQLGWWVTNLGNG